MSRRKLLAAGGGVAVVAAGGWLAYTQFLGSSGPAGTVRQFYSALTSGNAQRVNSMLHPNSPMSRVSSQQLQMLQGVDISVESASVVQRTDTRATVNAQVSVSGMGVSQTQSVTIELRTYNGEWRIYDSSGML